MRHTDRYLPATGMAVLVLTATNWLVSHHESRSGTADRDVSLWGLFDLIARSIVPLTILGVVVVLAFALIAFFWPAHRSPIAVTVAGAGAAVTALVVILIGGDSGFSGGPGAWLTLLLGPATAVLALTERAATPSTAPE